MASSKITSWVLVVILGLVDGLGATESKLRNADDATDARLLGLNLPDEQDNRTAGMWLMALILTLTSALPAVLLNSSLAFRRRSDHSSPFWLQDLRHELLNRMEEISRIIHRLENSY